MKHAHSIILLGFATLIAVTACKKEESSTPDGSGGGSSSSTPNTVPFYADADGVMAAVRVFTTQSTPIGPVDVTIGSATAVFTTDDFSSFVDVGGVSCNGEVLTRQSNNSFVHVPSATQPTGIDLTSSNEVNWQVAGANGFPGFQRNIAGPYPTVGPLSSDATVVRADGYTLSTGTVLGADSVIFTLGQLVRTFAGNTTSCTFSATELGALSTGTSIAQIVGYTSSNEVIDGKRIYFVKQASRSRSVTIQ